MYERRAIYTHWQIVALLHNLVENDFQTSGPFAAVLIRIQQTFQGQSRSCRVLAESAAGGGIYLYLDCVDYMHWSKKRASSQERNLMRWSAHCNKHGVCVRACPDAGETPFTFQSVAVWVSRKNPYNSYKIRHAFRVAGIFTYTLWIYIWRSFTLEWNWLSSFFSLTFFLPSRTYFRKHSEFDWSDVCWTCRY